MPAGVGIEVLALGAALGLVYVAVTLRSLTIGFAAFVVLSVFDQVSSARSLAGLLLAGLWVIAVTARGSRAPLLFRDHRPLGAAVLIFAGWLLASTLWAPDDTEALKTVVRLLQNLVLVLVAFTAISKPEHIRWVVGALVGAIAFAAVLGLTGNSVDGEATGGFDDPNQFAAIVAPALVLSYFAFMAYRGHPLRWAYAAVIPLLLLALVAADSQGGFVALMTGAVMAVLLAGPIRGRTAALGVLGVVAVVGFYAATGPPNLTEGAGSRTVLWRVALAVAADHPVAGVGAGGFPLTERELLGSGTLPIERADLVGQGYVTHNTYIEVLAEYGAVGVLLLLGLIGGSLLIARRAIRGFAGNGDRRTELLARGVMAASISMFVAFIFISAQYQKQLWIMLGLCAAMITVARRQSARMRADADAGASRRSGDAKHVAHAVDAPGEPRPRPIPAG